MNLLVSLSLLLKGAAYIDDFFGEGREGRGGSLRCVQMLVKVERASKLADICFKSASPYLRK